ncbi:NF-kappa-B inhibitor cactus-like [Mercenaria mercenaria]|uniref:NF-kappa-B inhibitor cactus-like n=1 Tax=Mercenaria mercenaria TaxID=6596 RepID=UPI00234E4E67|nr:NF-kappa-B inhibitor cactus-like [Mercenaria mercenaria]XP_053398885.1 NF-kappa-B inhibitor cactus-like [Mercenaria mercenaria]
MCGNDSLTKNTLEAVPESPQYSKGLNERSAEKNVSDELQEELIPRRKNVECPFQMKKINRNDDLSQSVLETEQEPDYSLSVGHSENNIDDSLNGNDDFNVTDNQLKDIDPLTIYSQDSDGDTLLHMAIILQKTRECMIFISLSPTYRWISFQNLLFQTPLHLAAITNQPKVTRRLVIAGANVTSQDKDGNTALHIACRDGRLDVLTSLLEPVRYSETKQNKYELPYQNIPQDFKVTNYDGLTCLHLAAINGHIDIIEILIKNDIDVNMKEWKTGRSVLHNACLKGDINLVKILLRHKACDINARAFDGSTPFDLARCLSYSNICMTLAGAGARYGEDHSDTE